MSKRVQFGLVCAVLVLAALWVVAQQPAGTLERYVPAGALVYVEARDLGALMRDWDASGEKRAWVAGANYSAFSRSHLFLRLADAQNEFATAAGVPPDYAMFSSVAGANSAVAIYDIGKLEFLYITRLPSARALNSALWQARGSYQTRRAGNTDYYVKTDRERTAAFAYTGDLLLLATRETALAGALELIAGVNRPALPAEPWFASAVAAAEPGGRDLRMVYNMERLAATYQFRSHWIQRNAAELREFASGLADLERRSGEIRERRVLLRAAPGGDRTASEGTAGQLLAMVPENAELYRAWAQPSSDQVSRWIAEKLFAEREAGAQRRDDAPAVFESGEAGEETDLEVRIDQAALREDRDVLAPVRARLAGVTLQAMLEVGSTRTDVFVHPQSALVLLADRPWNADEIRAALAEASNALWGGSRQLAVQADGTRLIIGNSADLVNAVWARRGQAAAAGAVYAAAWRHSRGLPNFTRMMRLIDAPEMRAVGEGAEPMFYSENLASLGGAMGRMQEASIAVHDVGAMLRETVIYRLTQ